MQHRAHTCFVFNVILSCLTAKQQLKEKQMEYIHEISLILLIILNIYESIQNFKCRQEMKKLEYHLSLYRAAVHDRRGI